MKKILMLTAFVLIVLFQAIFFGGVARASTDTWIKSASIIPQYNTDFASDNFKQSVRNFKAVGGNYINLIIPYYQSNSGSTDINPGWNTPTDDSLASGIQFVHSLGMKVELSIYLENYSGEWRAYIHPGDRTTWYSRYGDALVHYGQIANAQGVDLYGIGAELINMASAYENPDNTTQWNTMITRIRGVYSGPLVYSANRPQAGNDWASEASHIGFWNQMSYVGLSAYYELYGDDSVSSLENDWQNYNNTSISQLSVFGKPLLFTEIGYRSVGGTHDHPWNSWDGGNYDPQEQINDYTALIDYWNRQPSMQGVVLWWWNTNPGYGGNGNIDYSPQNKPVENTLKQFWLNSTPTPPPPPTPTPTPTPAPSPVSFDATASANPGSPNPGQPTSVSVSVRDTSGSLSDGIADVEIYNGDTQVFQQFMQNQNFQNGGLNSYTVSWTPNAAGTYTVKLGIFNNNWSQNYYWNNSLTNISVGSATPPPSPPPPPSAGTVTDIWWPTDGTTVDGVQPFKALVENTDLSLYTMYWQVDNGDRVLMSDSSTDYPHKEALVDVSNWNWSGGGPYSINFVSVDKNGAVISQKTVKIYTQ